MFITHVINKNTHTILIENSEESDHLGELGINGKSY
jgi:hypothetical protein